MPSFPSTCENVATWLGSTTSYRNENGPDQGNRNNADGQSIKTNERGDCVVTLRQCQQASVLFTSTLAAHL